MKLTSSPLILAGIALANLAQAQQRGPQTTIGTAEKSPLPPLMDCGAHGDLEIFCGVRSPEELELTPDGKFVIVSQFVTFRGGGPSLRFALFDPAGKTFTSVQISEVPRKDWGDPA